MNFWKWLFFLRHNSEHKEVLLTRILHEVMFSLRISLVNVNKSADTRGYRYLKMLAYGS